MTGPGGAFAARAEAALDWLAQVDAAASVIAAHEGGRADSRDDARRWTRWTLDGERNGTWDDSLLETVRALDTIRELRQAAGLQELDPAIGRGLDWIRSRRGQPGAWTDGCDPDRHRLGVCHHFAGGFYSPDLEPLVDADLPSGARTVGDAEARFALSARALRCTLLWRGGGTDTGLHLDALRHVALQWPDAVPPGLTATALLAAVHALLASDRDRDRDAAARALHWVSGHQRGDGSWVDADPFHAMAVFVAAAEVGVGGERVDKALGHGARLLAAAQREDGSWGPEHGPRRALIALRTLAAARN